MKNAPFTILKLIAILCFSSIFSTNTESKGEFKIIEMGQQVDPISKESFDLYTRSLVTSQDGFVYVPTLLGFRMYEILTGNKTKDISFPPTGKGCLASANNRGKIELSQNEKYLVMQAFCQIVQVDAKTGAIQRVLFNLDKDGFSTHSFAVSPDENILAVSTNYCIACIWNLKTNKLIVAYTPGFEKYGDLTFSSDGKILLIAGNNIWFQEKNQLKKFKSYIKNVILTNAGYNISFLSSNRSFISSGDDRDVIQKNTLTGDVLVRYKTGVRTDTFALSPNENLVATGGYDDTRIRLFNAKTGKLIKIFEGHTKLIYALAFSKDNKKLISSSLDHTIRIWNIN